MYRICAFVGAFCLILLFLFVPETFWDRSPVPKAKVDPSADKTMDNTKLTDSVPPSSLLQKGDGATGEKDSALDHPQRPSNIQIPDQLHVGFAQNSPGSPSSSASTAVERSPTAETIYRKAPVEAEEPLSPVSSSNYTADRKSRPPVSFVQSLKPFNGRLNNDSWIHVAIRPFILFSYPAVLWSAIVYACSVGWLIVLSESVTHLYRTPDSYNFSALSTGLIYISPFIGGILGTAVAGKASDVIVKAMSKRNGGLYEPEFRLVMVIPITITTVIGLMGIGWSDSVHDNWIVPTFFFGVISFGCSLGSTTAITFCVDSYRQYAGEALVTLNFSKNIFHGLAFSLFFPGWLTSKGSKSVFIWVGVIQLAVMSLTIPMYIFGKRARMWTVRKNFMERF
jgi:hypothetical protein